MSKHLALGKTSILDLELATDVALDWALVGMVLDLDLDLEEQIPDARILFKEELDVEEVLVDPEETKELDVEEVLVDPQKMKARQTNECLSS